MDKDLFEDFREWIYISHKLRIKGFLTEKESKNCMKRIVNMIGRLGYVVEKTGFYEYEFKKIKED